MRSAPALGLAFVLGLVLGIASATIPRWLEDGSGREAIDQQRDLNDHQDDAAGSAPHDARGRPTRTEVGIAERGPAPSSTNAEFAPDVVRGTVVRLDGTPFPDVEVTAEAETSWVRRSRTENPGDREAFLDRAARAYDERIASRVVTTTDVGGRFALALRSAQPHRLSAGSEEWFIATESGDEHPLVHAGDSVRLVARRLVTVDVDLVGPDGGDIQRGTIEFRTSEHEMSSPWTSTARTLRVPEGAWTATARSADGLRSAPQSVLLRPTAERPHLEFLLMGRLSLNGVIRFEDANPDGWVDVALAAVGAGEAASTEVLTSADRRLTVGSSSGYEFRFEDVSPGTYLVGAGRFGRIEASTRIEIVDQDGSCQLMLPALDSTGVVTIVAWTPDNIVTTQFKASVGFRTADLRSVDAAPSAAQPDGSVRVKLPESVVRWTNGSGEGEAWLEIVSPEFGALNVPLPRVVRPELRIAFSRPSHLTLKLGNSFNLPIEDVYFELQQSSGSGGMVRLQDASPDASRRVVFGAVTPADYELVTKVRSSHRENAQYTIVDRKPLTVRAASKIVTDYELPALHSLTIECPPRLAGSSIVVLRDGPADRLRISGTVDSSGRFELARLPAGHYDLEVHTPDGRLTRSFDLPPAAILRLP